MFAVDVVIFDLDGTLVDSVPDLTWATDRVMGDLGLPPRGPEKVAEWVGNGLDPLLHRAITDGWERQADDAQLNRARDLFVDYYRSHFAVDSYLYEGAAECLAALVAAGERCALCTNKPMVFTLPLLAKLGIDAYFDAVAGGDTLRRRKPHPEPLHYLLHELGTPEASAIMVGDSRNDILAARNAGFPAIATSYGYNHGRDIRDEAPDAVIDSLAELPPLLGCGP